MSLRLRRSVANSTSSNGRGSMLVDRVRAACHGVGENRLGVEQLARHPRVLAALPGEQPRRRRRVGALATDHARSQPVLGHLGQQLAGALDRIHDQRGPVFEMRTPGPGREAHVGDVDLRVARPAKPRIAAPTPPAPPVTARTAAARRPFIAVSGSEPTRRPRRVFVGDRRLWWRLLDQHVRVGAGEPEGTHAGTPRPAVGLPRSRLVHDLHRQGVPRNVRRRILEVQVLRQNFVLQRQHDLDQTGDARRRLEVPDVGLHRSDQQRPVRVTAGAVDGRRRPAPRSDHPARCPSRVPRGSRRPDRPDRHEPAPR